MCTGGTDWVARIDPRFVVSAAALETHVDGVGTTLAAVLSGGAARAGSGTALGSGAFGNVATYHYHGAAVAVKELKAGADRASIGKLLLVSRHRDVVPRGACLASSHRVLQSLVWD